MPIKNREVAALGPFLQGLRLGDVEYDGDPILVVVPDQPVESVGRVPANIPVLFAHHPSLLQLRLVQEPLLAGFPLGEAAAVFGGVLAGRLDCAVLEFHHD